MTVHTPLYLQKKAIPARFDRQLLADLFRAGVMRAGDFAPTASGGLTSTTAAGIGYIPGTIQVDQGVYRLYSDAPTTFTHDAAVTFPRMDQIVVVIYDSAENNNVGTDGGEIKIVKGVESNGLTKANRLGAASGANFPSNAILIADVIVRPASNILAADINDRRQLAKLAADIGDAKFSHAVIPPVGWHQQDGSAVDRLQFADLLARTTILRSGATATGSAVVTGLAQTSDLTVGMGVTGTGLPVGTYIQSVDSSSQITLSQISSVTNAAIGLSFYTTYSPPFTRTGTTANASTAVTGLPRTDDLYIGMPISGAGIPVGATVASITSSTAITISSNATASATVALTFRPHGAGDGVFTFNLPDMRGRSPMGAGAASSLTKRNLGDSAGEEQHALTVNEMPVHDHPFTGADFLAGASSGARVPNLVQNSADWQLSGGSSGGAGVNTAGGGSAHNVIHPVRALNPLIYTGTPF